MHNLLAHHTDEFQVFPESLFYKPEIIVLTENGNTNEKASYFFLETL